MTLSRRQFLSHCAAGLGMVVGAGCGGATNDEFVSEVVALAVTPDSQRAIGQAFLDDHDPGDLSSLSLQLQADLGWQQGLTAEELSDRLIRRIRSDYRESKTVRVRGWMLSETEVRWAAVTALAEPVRNQR